MQEADELLKKILNLIEEEGCEVIAKDVRTRDRGAAWKLDLKMSIKPVSEEEV